MKPLPLGSNITDHVVPSGRNTLCLAVRTAQRRTPSLWPEASQRPSGLKEQLRGPLYGSKSLCSLRHSRPVAISHSDMLATLSDVAPMLHRSSGLKRPRPVTGMLTSWRHAQRSQRSEVPSKLGLGSQMYERVY